jgi:hypothetical protein
LSRSACLEDAVQAVPSIAREIARNNLLPGNKTRERGFGAEMNLRWDFAESGETRVHRVKPGACVVEATPRLFGLVAQVVVKEGSMLVWGPACYALKDRDLWIGWSAMQRVERLKLIVQNRRFLLLPAKGQSPNLASQVLAAALRSLPAQWRECFGYRPLLAESFTDPEACEGTFRWKRSCAGRPTRAIPI